MRGKGPGTAVVAGVALNEPPTAERLSGAMTKVKPKVWVKVWLVRPGLKATSELLPLVVVTGAVRPGEVRVVVRLPPPKVLPVRLD